MTYEGGPTPIAGAVREMARPITNAARKKRARWVAEAVAALEYEVSFLRYQAAVARVSLVPLPEDKRPMNLADHVKLTIEAARRADRQRIQLLERIVAEKGAAGDA